MIGLSRTTFLGRSGRHSSVVYGSWVGTQTGAAVTLGAGTARQALARVLRDDWDTPGTTLTLRVYRRNGATRSLVTEGTVDSGPTSVKGVSKSSPALPMIASPAFADGEYELEVETSGGVRYAAEFAD